MEDARWQSHPSTIRRLPPSTSRKRTSPCQRLHPHLRAGHRPAAPMRATDGAHVHKIAEGRTWMTRPGKPGCATLRVGGNEASRSIPDVVYGPCGNPTGRSHSRYRLRTAPGIQLMRVQPFGPRVMAPQTGRRVRKHEAHRILGRRFESSRPCPGSEAIHPDENDPIPEIGNSGGVHEIVLAPPVQIQQNPFLE
jgi:hypothetical protein